MVFLAKYLRAARGWLHPEPSAFLLGWLLLLLISILGRLHLLGWLCQVYRLHQPLSTQIVIQIFVPTIQVRGITNLQTIFALDYFNGFSSCIVIVEKAMDSFIIPQRVQGFRKIGC